MNQNSGARTAGDGDVLVIVDVQNNFCPGGGARGAGRRRGHPGHQPARRAVRSCRLDPGLASARAHVLCQLTSRKRLFETVEAVYGQQVLWPDHCGQGTEGAAFHPGLAVRRAELVLRKGFRPEIDSYSAFRENDRRTPTGLAAYLRERGFERLTLCGLATAYCVLFSVLDVREAGFAVRLTASACRGIDLDGSLARSMTEAGVTVVIRTGAAEIGVQPGR